MKLYDYRLKKAVQPKRRTYKINSHMKVSYRTIKENTKLTDFIDEEKE